MPVRQSRRSKYTRESLQLSRQFPVTSWQVQKRFRMLEISPHCRGISPWVDKRCLEDFSRCFWVMKAIGETVPHPGGCDVNGAILFPDVGGPWRPVFSVRYRSALFRQSYCELEKPSSQAKTLLGPFNQSQVSPAIRRANRQRRIVSGNTRIESCICRPNITIICYV